MTIQLEPRTADPTVSPGPTGAAGPTVWWPVRWWRLHRGALVALVCAVLALPGATVAAIAFSAPAGALGHDVSYPQCDGAPPSTGTFGVVGVNGGRVSTANPCLSSQYAWASGRSGGAALYVNTGNPGAISTFYWPASGASDPALCRDRTSAADPGCAYDYGWHGAEDSLRIARSTLGSAVTSRSWWLDVELANSWNGTTTANAAALQGAVDHLRSLGVDTVGIYSTTYQWGQITGGYRAGTAATYRAAWAGAFTPRYPMEDVPLWIAGLGTREQAASNCAASFTGATAMLAQYTDGDAGGLDGDIVCGDAPAPPSATPTTSSNPTTTTTAPSTPGMTTATTAPSTPGTTSSTPTGTATSTTVPSGTTTSVVPPPAPSTTTVPSTTAPSTTVSPTTTTTPRPTTTTATPVARAPGAPTRVAARTHPVRGITLSWVAPMVTGGSPVTRYAILRGTSPGRETVLGTLACTTATCSWQDTAVTGGRVAYYQVVAINTANVAGPRSVEVAARGR